MRYLSLLICVISLAFLSCKTQSTDLSGKWTHAREKDHDGLQVFVKGENPELPPARFREVMIFDETGACEFLNMASNDGHAMRKGVYEIKGDKIIVTDDKGKVKYKFEIVGHDEDLLTLKTL